MSNLLKTGAPRKLQRGQASLLNRRDFLGLGAAATLSLLGQRLAHGKPGKPIPKSPGFGPLVPATDLTTGLPLIDLPEGFSYRSFGWTGDSMTNGKPTPARHDGMGVVLEQDGILTLLRNHEIWTETGSFAPPELTYDRKAGGGVTRIRFDSNRGEWLDSAPALGGTMTNCAGGVTPWGSYLSCEEDLSSSGYGSKLKRNHGYVFEVDALGDTQPDPIKDMGRFLHEACAVDPESGFVYMTEDNDTSGFYRFLPDTPGKLREGGRLQILKARDNSRLRTESVPQGSRFDAQWLDISDPNLAHQRRTHNSMGVFMQGYNDGGAVFRRGEGCIFANGKVVFACTTGGAYGLGQIWAYDTKEESLELILESPDKKQLNHPDNLALSPRGGLLLCEDGGRNEQQLVGMSEGGELFTFSRNKVVLDNQVNGIKGDFRASEWCGATFHDDWLFVNIQVPGISLAITGPWKDGLI